jgi:hypothetical protein
MPRRNTFQDVFRYYDLSGGLNDGKVHHERCWPWTGSLNDKNIPYFSVSGKSYIAHRIVYHLFNSGTFRLDSPLFIRHIVCDNSICGNPAHMVTGTHQENMNDAVAHGRFGLTIEQIDAIIKHNEEMPDVTHARLAAHFTHKFQRNVARSTITDILSGRRKQRRKEQSQ